MKKKISSVLLAVGFIITTNSSVFAAKVAVPNVPREGKGYSANNFDDGETIGWRKIYAETLGNFNKLYENTNDKPTYCIYDINKDDIPELIVKTGTCEADYKYEYFSYINNTATKIGERKGIHTCLMTYPSGNGIVENFQTQGAGSLTLVMYEHGALTEKELLPEGILSTYNCDIASYVPDSVYLNVETENKVSDFSALNAYVVINHSTTPTQTESEVCYDNIVNEVNQIQYYINQGLYLEAIALCDETSLKFNLSASDGSLISSFKETAQYNYELWREKLQRFTFRMSGWGMNVTCRGDMTVTNDENVIWLSPLDDGLRFFCIGSSKIDDEMYVNYKNIKIKNPKQFVEAQISDIKRIYSGQLEYGGKFDILSANYVNVSGFTAYQIVYRDTVYTNRYWTEGSHLIGKMIAFQYGQWIYCIWAEESSYNWSDDFWDAMEVVINGISFS